jgi:hypothetical protein
MNMTQTNKKRVAAILNRLEKAGWALVRVDNGGDEIPIYGKTAQERIAAAFEEIDSVDESVIYVRQENAQHKRGGRESFATIIISNNKDMLSDYGSLLESALG